jgi:Uma2 family endonuclease
MMAVAVQLHPQQGPGKKVYYPTRDGKPMGETDKHRDLMMYTIEALKTRYAAQPNVYVSGNNFVYWEEGNPKARISPDVYVVFGVPMRQRDLYKAWEEGGRLPDVVFEFTSKKTRHEDRRKKLPLYEQTLRVKEYFQFDPTGDYLRPRLQGFRLVDDRYVSLEIRDSRLHSEQLGLDLVQDGERLRLFDPQREEWLLTPLEQARRAAEAEAEVARLRAQLAALRGRPETNEH